MRYKYSTKEMDELKKSFVLVYDTHEKVDPETGIPKNKSVLDYAEKYGIKTKRRKLDYGDYTAMIPKNEKLGIYRDIYFDTICTVERKANVDELAGNLADRKERARIERELIRKRGKLLLLVEGNRIDAINGNYRSGLKPKSFINTLDAFEHRYDIIIDFQPTEIYCRRLFGWLWMGAREYLKFNLILAD